MILYEKICLKTFLSGHEVFDKNIWNVISFNMFIENEIEDCKHLKVNFDFSKFWFILVY